MPLLRRLSLALALEGVLLLGVGIAYGVTAEHTSAVLLVAGGAVVLGVVLLALARAVVRERRWSRAPALTLNLFALPLAADAFQSGNWPVGVVLLALPATVLYLFATPDLRAGFQQR